MVISVILPGDDLLEGDLAHPPERPSFTAKKSTHHRVIRLANEELGYALRIACRRPSDHRGARELRPTMDPRIPYFRRA